MKKLIFLLLCLLSTFIAPVAFAQGNSFVSIVNPVRGDDFWDLKDQKIETAVLGQIEILNNFTLPATWLIRFDALDEGRVIRELKNRYQDEKGLFLEVTPTWAEAAEVKYRKSSSWHAAGSAFLTGYERDEREKLIDKSFERFEKVFGYFPKSVGAWWIDSYSLDYMQNKYGITSGLIVADQYTTDNYQIWGQYFSTPYYPDKKNALHPAQSEENKIPVVLSQWAARDPVNGYGNGVFESTFSVQPNDYIDYHELDTNYFSKLVNLYTNQGINQFGAIVVGLENTYDWNKYQNEYKNQISFLKQRNQKGLLSVVTLGDFADWYQKTFPQVSPEHVIVADDPLGLNKKVVWFMNPYYRVGWFYNNDGSVIRDIRQYVEGEEEICFQKSCSEVNFATFATRVLDEVTYGHKLLIDEGEISDFKASRIEEKIRISYLNEAGKHRTVEFLPRDISIDGKISSIDRTILDAIKQDTSEQNKQTDFKEGSFSWSIAGVLSKSIKFLFFLLIVCLAPGLIFAHKLIKENEFLALKIFLALVIGIVLLTVMFYITSALNLRLLLPLYILAALLFFIKTKQFTLFQIKPPKAIDKLQIAAVIVVILGTIFQNIPTFKSGLTFSFGMGFWGPNTHDGIWHISLINQLIAGFPVENPIYAGTVLKNYHFFYDLLVASVALITRLPVVDLVFRFFPLLFSLLLGLGTYYLAIKLFTSRVGIVRAKIAAIFSLYFVYFAGSFGWIVEYIKQKSFGGESAFWANQAISYNLNPPFAVSLLIIIALVYLLIMHQRRSLYWIFTTVLLTGSLIGFKAYGAVLILVSLFAISIVHILKKDFSYFFVFVFSLIITLIIFLSNFEQSEQLIVFSPFWFIHSMIDSPDRVGWIRLTMTRIVGFQTQNYLKIFYAEGLSLLIFIAGNLGMRILSLFLLLKIKSISSSGGLIILIFSLASFLIPTLFIQSGNPWNTIQFTYYGLYMTAVISGLVLSSLFFSIPKLLSILLIIPILILTPINSITTASYYTGFLPHGRVDHKELQALHFLSYQDDGVVLTVPYDKKLRSKVSEPWPLFIYDSTAYVSALSKKSVYLEDEPQNQILLTDYTKRLVTSKDFFLRPISENLQFLKENRIKYIYIPKIYNLRLDESSGTIMNLFENEEVVIYKVVKLV